jgi:hypothetical protein
MDYSMNWEDKNADLEIDRLEGELRSKLSEITINLKGEDIDDAGIQKKINQLEIDLETLEREAANKDTYEHDLQQVDLLRNEYKNDALDLISLAYNAKVKEVALQRAYLEYMTIAQEATLIQQQYINKMLRYKDLSSIVFSASRFFQNASDLDLAETYIESARNDLSNYLTAVEYLTVRPFVDLRRSIYTARGTNDLLKIKAQIDDLTQNCGSGNESEHTVTISMRNRMGIADDEIGELSPATRFHDMLKMGTLPVSASTRYSVKGEIGDVLKKGEFYSGSFSLTENFANISGSCNAKITDIRIRFVSIEGTTIRSSGDAAPAVTIFYGGQSQLLSCHANIEAITKSIGNRTTFGKYSRFTTAPFGASVLVSMFNVPEGTDYHLESKPDFSAVSIDRSFAGYPLMATYSIVFDPKYGENSGINWDNVADIEIQFNYTTGSLGQDSQQCKFDI